MSEIQIVNATTEKEILVKKFKTIKSKLLTKKTNLIIEDDDKPFINQVYRIDIL